MSVVKKLGPAKDPSISAGIRYSFEFDSRVELENYSVINGVDTREDMINGLAQQFKLALRALIYSNV